MLKTKLPLSPKLDLRLAGRDEVLHRLAHPEQAKLRPTILLSRQFGCPAFPLAESLKQACEASTGKEWSIQDRALLQDVARKENISIFLLKNIGDLSADLEALGLNFSHHMTHEEAFQKLALHLEEVARKGNTIIIGHGGALLCEAMKNCYRFRLEASLEWRLSRVQALFGVTIKEAKNLIIKNARHRDKFISHQTGKDIDDLSHYDAIFNTEHHTETDMAAAILAFVQNSWPDPYLFKG